MRISKQTIAELAGKGIEVKYYPTGLAGMREDTYKKRIDYILSFKEGQSLYWHEHYINAQTSIEEIQEYAREYVDKHLFMDTADEHFDYHESHRWYDAQTLYIFYDGKTIVKKENQKSKEITADYVLRLVEKNERAYAGYYGQFALNMQKLLQEAGLAQTYSIYPTTYGIGVWVLYNFSMREDCKQVTNILDSKGVVYENEYSEAGWVYRYKVSKKAENLAKLEAA